MVAAGLPAFGEPFPGHWKKTIGEANPEGFYESSLRHGIYYRTNPHPQTGAYFFPEQVRRHVVKVFVPGLVRSDRAYVGKVVATVRRWEEYEASLARLYAMEAEHRAEGAPEPVRMPAWLEWWTENFALIRDVAIRRYPVHVQSYDGLLEDPAGVIRKTLGWLELDGLDVDGAVAAVKPEHRTQQRPISDSVPNDQRPVFDDFYALVHAGEGMSNEFIQTLNATNEALLPRIREHEQKVTQDQARRRAAGRPLTGDPPPPDEDPMD